MKLDSSGLKGDQTGMSLGGEERMREVNTGVRALSGVRSQEIPPKVDGTVSRELHE